MARFDPRGDVGFRFKSSPAAGNVYEGKSVEDTPVLPIERETFRVATWWIAGVQPDARFAGGGGVKPPILIASADGKIAVERSGAGFHRTTEGLVSSPVKSSFQLLKSILSTRNGILSIGDSSEPCENSTLAKITSGINFQFEFGLESAGRRGEPNSYLLNNKRLF